MNTKTLIAIIIVNCAIIALVVSSLISGSGERVVADGVKPESVSDKNFATDSVRIVMDDDLPFYDYMNEIKAGLSYFNPKDVQRFNEDGWRFIISKELDFTDSDYNSLKDDDKAKIESFTNVKTKIVYIKENAKEPTFVRQYTILGMCQFIDYINEYYSSTEEFVTLMKKYPKYTEYRYLGVEKTEDNKDKINQPNKSNINYFTYSMRDYLMYPEYVSEQYPELFDYFTDLYPRQKHIEDTQVSAN